MTSESVLEAGMTPLTVLLRVYANAAHWWAEASDREIEERGDSRDGARNRMLDAESALLLAGYEFLS